MSGDELTLKCPVNLTLFWGRWFLIKYSPAFKLWLVCRPIPAASPFLSNKHEVWFLKWQLRYHRDLKAGGCVSTCGLVLPGLLGISRRSENAPKKYAFGVNWSSCFVNRKWTQKAALEENLNNYQPSSPSCVVSLTVISQSFAQFFGGVIEI